MECTGPPATGIIFFAEYRSSWRLYQRPVSEKT